VTVKALNSGSEIKDVYSWVAANAERFKGMIIIAIGAEGIQWKDFGDVNNYEKAYIGSALTQEAVEDGDEEELGE
jgi:hypothetical protein